MMSEPYKIKALESLETEEGIDLFSVEVAADIAFVDGHFPDHPVVPAIGQLVLFDQLLKQSRWKQYSFEGLHHLKVLQTLMPEDKLTVKVGPLHESLPAKLSVTMHKDHTTMTQGQLLLGLPT